MNWSNYYFKNIFFTWIDVGTIVMVLGAFVISYHLNPFLTAVTWNENQFKISFFIVLIAISNLLLYKSLLPKFTGSHQYKAWQLLSYAADSTFWVLLFCWIFLSITEFFTLFKFGLIFWAFITLFLVGWFILIKNYHQKNSLSKRYKLDALPNLIYLTDQYQQQTILITGAAGTIGKALAHQLALISKGTILLLDQSETGLHNLMQTAPISKANLIPVLCDIRSTTPINQIFEQYKPNIVFHAAAYKQLPILEHFPTEAVATNIIGTKNLVDAAIRYQVQKFVFISTDKAVKPNSVLGTTKKIAEAYVKLKLDDCITTRWAVVRFGNVWNSNGSVLPLWEQQLKKGTSIEVRNPNASRYFISVSKVTQLLLELGTFPSLDQKYLLLMGEPILIQKLAVQYVKSRQYEYISRLSVNYTNLLEGEKVHEALISDDELLKESIHPEINTIVSSAKETPFLEDDLKVLFNSYQTMDQLALKQKLNSLLQM